MSKITIKKLLEDKEKISKKARKQASLYVKSLDGEVVIQAPTASQTKDAQDTDYPDEYIIYNCLVEPNLKDEALQKEFGCIDPIEIVSKIFDAGEIPLIAVECLRLSGYVDGVKVVADIKK
jgi:hypothetical protein